MLKNTEGARRMRSFEKKTLESISNLKFLVNMMTGIGLSQSELARSINSTTMGVSYWFKKDNMRFANIFAICDIYDLNLAIIITRNISTKIRKETYFEYKGSSEMLSKELESTEAPEVKGRSKKASETAFWEDKTALLKEIVGTVIDGADKDAVFKTLGVSSNASLYRLYDNCTLTVNDLNRLVDLRDDITCEVFFDGYRD